MKFSKVDDTIYERLEFTKLENLGIVKNGERKRNKKFTSVSKRQNNTKRKSNSKKTFITLGTQRSKKIHTNTDSSDNYYNSYSQNTTTHSFQFLKKIKILLKQIRRIRNTEVTSSSQSTNRRKTLSKT